MHTSVKKAGFSWSSLRRQLVCKSSGRVSCFHAQERIQGPKDGLLGINTSDVDWKDRGESEYRHMTECEFKGQIIISEVLLAPELKADITKRFISHFKD